MCHSRARGCLVSTNLGHVPTRMDGIYTAGDPAMYPPVSTPSSFRPSLTLTVPRLCPGPLFISILRILSFFILSSLSYFGIILF